MGPRVLWDIEAGSRKAGFRRVGVGADDGVGLRSVAKGCPERWNTGLGILFHESSHVLSARMHRLLEAELAAHAKRVKAPPELWHAVIFYCVGEVMRRNVPGYEAYADEQKLWQREWPGLLPVLEATFKEYIGGKGTLLGSVSGLVVGL